MSPTLLLLTTMLGAASASANLSGFRAKAKAFSPGGGTHERFERKKVPCGRPLLAEGLQSCSSYGYRSKRPIHKSRKNLKTFLNFNLKVFEYKSAKAAAKALAALLASADTNTGLSYAWDYVEVQGKALRWLSAPCRLSRKNWRRLIAALSAEGTAKGAFSCSCGAGCGS